MITVAIALLDTALWPEPHPFGSVNHIDVPSAPRLSGPSEWQSVGNSTNCAPSFFCKIFGPAYLLRTASRPFGAGPNAREAIPAQATGTHPRMATSAGTKGLRMGTPASLSYLCMSTSPDLSFAPPARVLCTGSE